MRLNLPLMRFRREVSRRMFIDYGLLTTMKQPKKKYTRKLEMPPLWIEYNAPHWSEFPLHSWSTDNTHTLQIKGMPQGESLQSVPT